MVKFAELAQERGDRLWPQLAYALAQDGRWQRDWSEALTRVALVEHAENVTPVREWIALWAPRIERALPPLCSLWVIAPERANAYAADVVAQCRKRWQALGLVTAAE
jgi:hypothetical protein